MGTGDSGEDLEGRVPLAVLPKEVGHRGNPWVAGLRKGGQDPTVFRNLVGTV